MTHYLIKHADGEWRLHDDTGAEPTGDVWASRPDTNELASAIAAAGPGGSLLGDDALRAAFVDIVSGGLIYRDLTINGETKPF
jgi:hypothetical protein